MGELITSIEGGVATMVMNRPEARNALSDGMLAGMHEFLARVERDEAVRCVVLKGAGEHFMAGGDVKRFAAMAGMAPEERRRHFEARIHANLHPVMYLMRRMPKPTLAAIQGAAAGFGLSLALACDLAIAADNAFFTLAYVNIGTSPDGSGTYHLARVVGMRKALEIAYLGDRFDAREAERLGLVNFVVAAAEFEAATARLAGRLASGPTRAMANTKRLLQASLDRDFEAQLQAEALSFADCATSEDWAEGVRAFAEKRPPRFQGR
ncbi:MAG: enoyl-CoA hydratase/isomerase family protein [Alphaproteobacteria bacterium]|nr:enoyl-CoA hydratase/isomerase family protein [Alphaproteobacteria bacterium]